MKQSSESPMQVFGSEKSQPEFHSEMFKFRENALLCEDVLLADLALQFGTPTYVYSSHQLERNCQAFIQAFSSYPTLVCFAVKANSNLKILSDVFGHGLGADLVSEGELERALISGCDPQKIVFSGVGKRIDELEKALSKNILMFNVESSFELKMIKDLARKMGIKARISIRVNPNINAQTHAKIATGLYTSKFGIPESMLPELMSEIRSESWLDLVGISCHIGSQMTSLEPIRESAKRMVLLATELQQQGAKLRYLDLGGGLGISYSGEIIPSVEAYAEVILEEVRKTGLQLILEPGRSIVGSAGVLLTRVIGVKPGREQFFVILDSAMNDLMRPALYDSYHPIVSALRTPGDTPKVCCQFVGPICETSDILGVNRWDTLPKAGDLYAITYAGAYGSSMSSQYNSRPRAAEVQVRGSHVQVIRNRETLRDLWALEWPGRNCLG